MNTRKSIKKWRRIARRAAAFAAIPLALSWASRESGAQPPRAGESTSTTGVVRSFTTAPMGEVDGAVLEDGTVIHWPPHLADRFTAATVSGDRIKAVGWMETDPEGKTHLEIWTLTNLRTDVSVENDAGPPPPPPGPGPGRGRRPRPIPPPPPGPPGRGGPLGPRFGAQRSAEGRIESLTTAARVRSTAPCSRTAP
jgi:hypothetical protein